MKTLGFHFLLFFLYGFMAMSYEGFHASLSEVRHGSWSMPQLEKLGQLGI